MMTEPQQDEIVEVDIEPDLPDAETSPVVEEQNDEAASGDSTHE